MQQARELVDKRRKAVYELVLQGQSQSALAKQFGVGLRQIESDVQHMRKEGAKRLKKQTVLGKVHDYDKRAQARIRRLWSILRDKTNTPGIILKAIRELREEDLISIKRKQIVGLLPQDAVPLINIEKHTENKLEINVSSDTLKKMGDVLLKDIEEAEVKHEH